MWIEKGDKELKEKHLFNVVCICASPYSLEEVLRIYAQKTYHLNVCLLPSFIFKESESKTAHLIDHRIATQSEGGSIQLDFAKIEMSDEVHFINLSKEWSEENTAQLTYAFVLGKKISFLKEENIPDFYKDLLEKRTEPYEI